MLSSPLSLTPELLKKCPSESIPIWMGAQRLWPSKSSVKKLRKAIDTNSNPSLNNIFVPTFSKDIIRNKFEAFEYLLSGKSDLIHLPSNLEEREPIFSLLELIIDGIGCYPIEWEPILLKMIAVQSILISKSAPLAITTEIYGRLLPLPIHSRMFSLPLVRKLHGRWENSNIDLLFSTFTTLPSSMCTLRFRKRQSGYSGMWYSFYFEIRDNRLTIKLANKRLAIMEIFIYLNKSSLKVIFNFGKFRFSRIPFNPKIHLTGIPSVDVDYTHHQLMSAFENSDKISSKVQVDLSLPPLEMLLLSLHPRFSPIFTVSNLQPVSEITEIVFSD